LVLEKRLYCVARSEKHQFTKNVHLQLHGDLKGETESELTAAQYHALRTKFHAKIILQTETQSKG